MKTLLYLTLCQVLDIIYGQIPKPAIRVRLNEGVFEQASSIVAGLIDYEVPRIRIPNTQQCFTEGCVQIHSFQVASFRQPQTVSFLPSPPNQFTIQVTDFDFLITGQLSGTIQVIIEIPVVGNVFVTGHGISVSAYLDLQKTVGDEPYLRFLQCQIDAGYVETRVANMGIFTDTVNTKYKTAMSAQSRILLEEAICNNMHRLTQQHFSSRLARLPAEISAKEVLQTLFPSDGQVDFSADTNGQRKITFTSNDLSNFFNINRLSHLMIDLTLLDASATNHDFSVGMAGNVVNKKTNDVTPFHPPFPFRLPHNNQRRMVEVIISEYTINSLLFHGHRSNSLLFHVDSQTPGVGSLLKTTCSLDEVCLSDQIEEIGSTYPDSNLELIIRTTSPPTIKLDKDIATINMEGRCLFFLEGTRQKIGVIPFSSTIVMHLKTVGRLLNGKVSITRLVFEKGGDFFNLTIDDLDGLRTSTKTALETMANAALKSGVPLSTNSMKLPLRMSAAHFSIDAGIALLQANVDLYNSLYSYSTTNYP